MSDDNNRPFDLSDIDPNVDAGQPSSCECKKGPQLPRRTFLKVGGVGMVGTLVGGRRTVMAGGFSGDDLRQGHLIPVDKKLDPDWVRALRERGEKQVYQGKALENIGMPCGGIGTGQLYLCGDGTLGGWQIFNDAKSNWVGNTHATYKHRGFAKSVEQGFAVAWRFDDKEKPKMANLRRDGFNNITFNGQYPIGLVDYAQDDIPVRVTMEAFSPFIPLNADDSGLPATIFHITVRNDCKQPVRVSALGWLENAICRHSATELAGMQPGGRKVTRVVRHKNYSMLLHGAANDNKAAAPPKPRAPIVFDDFEDGNYDGWTLQGKAFGKGPATGTLPHQQSVSGFEGKKLVNSFLDGDAPTGKMTSRRFTINRRFINVKVGGGGDPEKERVTLVVDGRRVYSASGTNTEKLRWVSWPVHMLEGKEARIEIIDLASSSWGHVLADQIEFSDQPRVSMASSLTDARDFGTMALACTPSNSEMANPLSGTAEERFIDRGQRVAALTDTIVGRVRTDERVLEPGQTCTFTFVLSWHFPNAPHGHAYAVRFADAEAVARHVLVEHDRLTGETRRWRDTYYDSTLPFWLLDRLHSTISTLATGTCQWWANGRFYAYEGVTCCPGTCTHVWNYAHGHARLFPSLAKSIRSMQDFCPRDEGGGFHPDTGLVGFRSNDAYAADGQCGTILKAYREHRMSSDRSFLQKFWPRIKKAMEYSIQQDGNADGLIENSQHNTYDINYEGANTFVGALYLAALRAAEEMAREMGDSQFAARCRKIFESGRRLSVQRLWNGEYFIQNVDLKKYPKHQYADGCLSDQLFGQGWARQVALGDIYPDEMVQKALHSIWKYNWSPDVTPYSEVHKPLRWFISPGQAGLFTCTWPRGDYLPDGTLYKNEVWTGIEYQVAGHMIAEGLVTEGLAICRAIHDRYQPEFSNPYNEVECGDHYARAMASWGVYLALAGFDYHGPKKHLAFAPRITPDHFKSAFTTAEGWGTFEQRRGGRQQTDRIHVVWGKLALDSLTLAAPEPLQTVAVLHNGHPVAATSLRADDRMQVKFPQTIVMQRDDTLEIRLV